MVRKFALFVTVVVLVLSIPISSFAEPSRQKENEKSEMILQADRIISSSKNVAESKERLKKAGWIEVPLQSVDSINPLSSGSCGSITNSTMKQFDSQTNRWMYLMNAAWDFSSSCSADDYSNGAPDVIAVGVVTETGQAVNRQAEYAGIDVRDQFNNYSSDGWVQDYNSSSATFAFEDSDNFFAYVGDNGQAWFYIEKPTNGTNYYIRSSWEHNWATTSTGSATTSISVSFPWALSISYTPGNTTTTINSWRVSDQDIISFN